MKIRDLEKQIDVLYQEKKDLNQMYQDKMQGIIKEKEDLSTSLQHAETKLQKIEADREQLKLQSNQ